MVNTNEKQKQKTVRRPIVSLRRRQMWGTLLLGATILISGIGIGFGSTLGYLSDSRAVAETPDPEQEQPTKVAMQFSEKVSKMVGLDKQQEGKIKEIMGKRFKAMHEVRKKAMEEMVAIHREISDDMRGVMKPDQFKRWEKHNEEARKRSKFRHHRWGRGSQRGDRDGRGKHTGRGWTHGQSRSRPSGIFDMFKRLDKDNNGELTKDEIEKIRGPFQQLIKKADVNGDGKVDRKEYDTQLRRRRPSSWPGRDRKPRDRPEGNRAPSSAPAQDLSML